MSVDAASHEHAHGVAGCEQSRSRCCYGCEQQQQKADRSSVCNVRNVFRLEPRCFSETGQRFGGDDLRHADKPAPEPPRRQSLVTFLMKTNGVLAARAGKANAGRTRRRFDRRCRRSAGMGHARLLADARHVTGHVSAGVQQAASTWSFTTCVSVPGGSSAAPYLGSEARSSKPSPFILLSPGVEHRRLCRHCLA